MKKVLRLFAFLICLAIIAASGYVYYSDYLCRFQVDSARTDIQTSGQHSSSVTETDKTEEYKFSSAGNKYFDDALFIGDSRTVGLKKHFYSVNPNTEFFARVGITVYRIFNIMEDTGVGYQRTLLDVLRQDKKFGKIYIMLGVNEITADLNESADQFCRLLNTVREYQPDAIIYIQANLHVAAGRETWGELYSNERLEEYNQMLAINADWENVFYIDPNEVYDDAEGNLDDQHTGDDIHILDSSYGLWIEYLKNHVARK